MVNKAFVSAYLLVDHVLMPSKEYVIKNSTTKEEHFKNTVRVYTDSLRDSELDAYSIIALKMWMEKELHQFDLSYQMLVTEISKCVNVSKIPSLDSEGQNLLKSLELLGFEQFINTMITEGEACFLEDGMFKRGVETLENAGLLGSAKAYKYLVQHLLTMDQKTLKNEDMHIHRIVKYLIEGSKIESSEGNQCNAILASIYSGLYMHLAEPEMEKAQLYWNHYFDNLTPSTVSAGDGPFVIEFILAAWMMDSTEFVERFREQIGWLKYAAYQYLEHLFKYYEEENQPQDELYRFYKKIKDYFLNTYQFNKKYMENHFKLVLPLKGVYKKVHQVRWFVEDTGLILQPGSVVKMSGDGFVFQGYIRRIELVDDGAFIDLDLLNSVQEISGDQTYLLEQYQEVEVRIFGEIRGLYPTS